MTWPEREARQVARRRLSSLLQVGIAAGIGFAGSLGVMASGVSLPDVRSFIAGAGETLTSRADCDIKGNISIETGERIYHVRGQKYYAPTRISPEYGERWFCSEAEARAAGWRKSKS
jgi:hypothetical protein